MNIDAYSQYCPLRNYLRKQKLNESLLAIHAHLQFQQFNMPLPPYITGAPFEYRSMTKFTDLFNCHMFPWELSLICKEILLNSDMYGAPRSLLEWNYLVGAVNKLKDFENELAKLYSTTENVLLEIFRISHRQFRWQRIPRKDEPARYWKIFSYPNLHTIVQKAIGLEIEEIIKIGMSLLGTYLNKIAIFYPIQATLPGIDREKIDKFLEHFCINYDDLKIRLSKEQQYNEQFAYAYSSLTAYPLIRKEWAGRDAIICPIPRYLFERITDGIYYEICRVENFDHPFGDAFQEYVGEVIRQLFKRGRIFAETKYGKDKRSVDWIIEDNRTSLFIECKTKRLTTFAKAALFDITKLELELGKLADAVVQVYKTMEDFKLNLYPNLKYDSNRDVYPIIVTLENWLLFGDTVTNKLDELIVNKLKKVGLSANLINTNPYCIISIDTFEVLVSIINKYGITEVLEEKLKDKEKRSWEMENYLRNKYPEEIKQTGCPFVPELDKKIDAILSGN